MRGIQRTHEGSASRRCVHGLENLKGRCVVNFRSLGEEDSADDIVVDLQKDRLAQRIDLELIFIGVVGIVQRIIKL